jgi:hypothetical protein
LFQQSPKTAEKRKRRLPTREGRQPSSLLLDSSLIQIPARQRPSHIPHRPARLEPDPDSPAMAAMDKTFVPANYIRPDFFLPAGEHQRVGDYLHRQASINEKRPSAITANGRL